MEEHVEIYIWLPTGISGHLKAAYGHAAMLIPLCPEVSEFVKVPRPLYISFHGTEGSDKGHFIDQQRDTEHWEQETGCYLEKVSLACTKEQVVKMWKSVLSMKDPKHADKDSFEQRGRYYIPYRHSDAETIVYPISFGLMENRKDNSDSHNCTTLIFKLLKAADVKLPGDDVKLPADQGSNKCQKMVTGGLQLLNGAAVGYNVGVAVEICEACLPEQTQHIKKLAIASFVIMGLAFLADIFCMPRIFQQNNCITQQTDKNCLRSVLKSLPILMLSINLILFIATASIHVTYHAFLDSIGIGLALGIGSAVGVVLCLLSTCRSVHHDAHTFVTKPEALLELLGKKKQKITEPVVKSEEMSEETTTDQNTHWGPFLSEAPKKDSIVTLDNLDSLKRNNSDEDTSEEDSKDDLLTMYKKQVYHQKT